MRVKTIAVPIFLMIILYSVLCDAEDTLQFGDYKYYYNNDSTVTISKWKGETDSLLIPAEIDAHKVTRIGGLAFYNCQNLVNIELPETILEIEDGAFYYCNNLESIVLPKSVHKIGDRAFEGCWNLVSIKIPESVSFIGDKAFYDCKSINSFAVSPDNKHYGVIDNVLFDKVNKVLIYYPRMLRLTHYAIPQGVISIGDYAFSGCNYLQSVEIPESIRTIGNFSFEHCENLTSIKVPEGVEKIGERAFNSCASLTSIELPSSIAEIGDVPFEFCSNLTQISVSESNSRYMVKENVLFDKVKKELVCYPLGLNEDEYQVPNDVMKIGKGAFSWNTKLKKIRLSEDVEEIGDNAFYACVYLSDILLPVNLRTIGASAFYGTELTSVIVPDGVSEIGKTAFESCTKLTKIKIPNSVQTIGDGAFGSGFLKNNNLTIVAERDSYAAAYAKENDIYYEYTDANNWLYE